MNKKTLKIYDTCTGKYVDVPVSDTVYQEYRRAVWREEKNDAHFFDNEIQFSVLIGGNNGNFENFHEFIAEDHTVAEAIKRTNIDTVLCLIEELEPSDKDLLKMVYVDNRTERECASAFGISQKNINKKKKRILAKLHNLLKK
ncbi:MAG: hypothetical protein ILA24_00010 [Ruminococcus sp.]|nr:hypothetical protein [Ruminococcus sp.]